MAFTMGDRTTEMLLTLLLLFSWCLQAVTGLDGGWTEDVTAKERGLFILGKFKRVVKTDEGEVKVVSGYRWKGEPNPIHIGFVNMEPNTLFIPQYVDANLVLFVRSGEARIGWIHKDKLARRNLRTGDITAIPAGSTFYLTNHCRDQRLQIITSIDSTESLSFGSYQSFFVGGGANPTSILSGFDPATLTAAFNVTSEELEKMMTQKGGPIIRMNNEHAKHAPHDEEMEYEESEESDFQKEKGKWTWKKFLEALIGKGDQKEVRKEVPIGSPHPCNIYDRKPDFHNTYGSSIAIDAHNYSPLKHSGVSVYHVNLTAGSMMAPHVNPAATEYGIVVGGRGTIQVVFPNGSAAMNAAVEEGDVFWIPRYFPFCQVASQGGPLELFGFTTSSRRNRPQFLAGRSSVLRTMRGAELAAAFGVSKEELERVVKAQREEVILPAAKWGNNGRERGVDDGEVFVMKRRMFA